MAARNKPAGIRPPVYGIGKGKVRIEGLSVSVPIQRRQAEIRAGLEQAERERFFRRFLAIADCQRLINAHGLVADRGD